VSGSIDECARHAITKFAHYHFPATERAADYLVRMGEDPGTSALDRYCRFRGVENLYVVDGSFMPTSAGLNPSLTIAATALRVGEHVLEVGDE